MRHATHTTGIIIARGTRLPIRDNDYRAEPHREPEPPRERALGEALPNHVAVELNAARHRRGHVIYCDCGQPAAHLGVFGIVSPSGWPQRGAMFLCDGCASMVDAGVTVQALPTDNASRALLAPGPATDGPARTR